MPPLNSPSPLSEILKLAASELGVRFGMGLNEEASEKLCRYGELLHDWSPRVDLVAPASKETILLRHIVDSLGVSFVVRSLVAPSAAVVDIGSGAGLPGIVLAVAEPERKVILIEPREKRCIFLKEVRRELGLSNVLVLQKRIQEVLAEELMLPFLALSRAVGMEAEMFQEVNRLGGLGLSWVVGPSWTPPELPKEATLEETAFEVPQLKATTRVATARCFT